MKACVVGLGLMGSIHARALTDLGYDVTTVDPAGHAHYAALPHRRFDVACVAVPMQHLAEAAAEWSGWYGRLLIEKPGATSCAEIDELRSSLTGQRVAVGYCERFNPQAVKLKACVKAMGSVEWATFRRWNTRPSVDVGLDLKSHDVDLARWLGVYDVAEFDTRTSDGFYRPHRRVGVEWMGAKMTVDLMAHSESPVHAQWRMFLLGGTKPATLEDAAAVLEVLRPQLAAAV